ncbi:hypothetical protein FH972_026402 [Carpinus fangiana]|uniref:Uncharacterized protein n=1 Tax=Carpinus fangiana TaxID=176857 RepID=A0A5N6L480_9ROSI|nr:hypothetical protein FH972_026402 [Carpinus fangiana]
MVPPCTTVKEAKKKVSKIEGRCPSPATMFKNPANYTPGNPMFDSLTQSPPCAGEQAEAR